MFSPIENNTLSDPTDDYTQQKLFILISLLLVNILYACINKDMSMLPTPKEGELLCYPGTGYGTQ